MDNLLINVLRWLMTNNYRRASFDRIIGIVPEASTYDQLEALVVQNPEIMYPIQIKGGLPGLRIHDDVNIVKLVSELTGQSSIANTTLTAPPAVSSVTPTEIEQEIASEYYMNLGDALGRFNTPLQRVTLCVITLKNEFTVIGKSACIYPENFNADVGQKLAREDAIRQLWVLLGFRLADRRINSL